MESITNNLSELAMTDIQRETLCASNLLVLRRMALDHLSSEDFDCYDIEAHRTTETNESTLPRSARHILSFTDSGRA
jgi:hypothetical protein